MRHFEHHRPGHAHVMKHDHCPTDLTVPVVDRSGGVFYCGFISVASNQDAVPGQSHGPVFLNFQIKGILWGLMRSPVNNLEHLSERTTNCLLPRPSSHMFRNYIQVGYVARNVGAQYGVTDGV